MEQKTPQPLSSRLGGLLTSVTPFLFCLGLFWMSPHDLAQLYTLLQLEPAL